MICRESVNDGTVQGGGQTLDIGAPPSQPIINNIHNPNPRSSIDDDDFDYNDGIAAVASVEGPV